MDKEQEGGRSWWRFLKAFKLQCFQAEGLIDNSLYGFGNTDKTGNVGTNIEEGKLVRMNELKNILCL